VGQIGGHHRREAPPQEAKQPEPQRRVQQRLARVGVRDERVRRQAAQRAGALLQKPPRLDGHLWRKRSSFRGFRVFTVFRVDGVFEGFRVLPRFRFQR
jgi:hypothetical protein